MTIAMKTLPAGTFKAQCLALMDEVEATREPIVITKRGKPVARLVPVELEEEDEIFGFMAGKGTITILGDIVEPVIPIEEWESLNDPA
jgi:prevent-host-death family protein